MASIPRLAAGSSGELVECRDELVTDILSRVSTRDLLKMSTVSKRWRSLIWHPDFVHTHYKNCQRESGFCLMYMRTVDIHRPPVKQYQFSSYDFQTGNLSVVPFLGEGLGSPVQNWKFGLLTTSNGLMCFYPRFTMDALLWVYNPVSKFSKTLTLPFKVDLGHTYFAVICYMQNTLKFVMAGLTGFHYRLCTLVFDFHSNSWYEGPPLPKELSHCKLPGAHLFFNGVIYLVARISSRDAQELRGIRDVEVLFSDDSNCLHMIIGYDVNQNQWGFSHFIPSTVGFIYCITEWEGNLLVCASTSTHDCYWKIRNSHDEGDGHFVFWIFDTEHKLWIRERELDLSHQFHNACKIWKEHKLWIRERELDLAHLFHNACKIWKVSASGGVVWFTCCYSFVIVYHMKTRCCSTYRLDDVVSLPNAEHASFVSFEPTLLSF